MNHVGLSRRGLLAAGGFLLVQPGLAWGAGGAVVETAQGRYEGLVEDGVHVFRGMRYGASTAGARRFLPPLPAEPFAGVREAFEYGDQTPQAPGGLAADTAMSEDCLRINVWTPALDGRKRPVLLWFHGGGFEAGSGSSGLYNGANMAKRGDVVVCTTNHRLNVFGYCDLSEHLGPEFAQSGNVGYLDLVQSMRWVRENIERFGGDPDNILIYGQSGGGRKVSCCFAGTEARGMFRKGVIQSGAHPTIQTKAQSYALTNDLLRRLDISPANARALQQVDQQTLSTVQRQVIGDAGYRFEPNLDGIAFTEHPFVPGAPMQTSQVPMMLGTAQTELSNQLGSTPGVHDLDDAGLRAAIARYLPQEDVDEAIEVFKASTPSGDLTEIFFKITSWRSYIRNAHWVAEKRAELNAGRRNPTWMYQVTWRSPVENGRRYSQHSSDLPFMFDNVALPQRYTGPETVETKTMADAMAGAWLAFAHNDDPNHDRIPHWPAYDLESRPVMQFDYPPELVNDPVPNERRFMERYSPVRQTARRDDN